MKKIFTLFFAALMSVGMFATTEVTATTYTLQLVADSTKGSVAVSNLLGSGIIDNGNGNYTVPANAEVTILATPLEGYEFSGWKVGNRWCDFTDCGTALNTIDNPMTITMTADVAYKADFAAVATTYTLQLVADSTKGSVAVSNLLGSGIIDNGNGNYTVPANAEVTILATPLEGYEFTGWKVGNINEMVGCYYCGTALNTEDNPYTFTMTADVAYLAEFEAALQPDPTVMFIAFPTQNRPENIQIAGVNREFTWAMVALDNAPWYVSSEHLNTYATDTIKFRDANNNAMILCEFIPANGDQEGRWQQLYLVMGNYPMASYKLDTVRLIDDLDLTNADSYAWLENAPEPLPEGLENIAQTKKAHKIVVNGMIYIVRDEKLYNLTGVQVK